MAAACKDYDPARDVPDLSGKVILLTGGTAGLGRETVLTLAKHNPAHIFFTGRNAKSASAVVAEVEALKTPTKISFIECDLASLTTVKKAADEFLSASSRLDLLLCNAGIMALPPALTADGYELQFGTNHMGHALLIKLLLPTLLRTAAQPASDVRIIITSSNGFQSASGISFSTLHTPQDSLMLGSVMRYGQSKLANVLYAQELARRYPQLTSASIHPGVIITGLVTNSTWITRLLVALVTRSEQITIEDGVKNGLWAATAAKEKIVNGAFYEPVGTVGRTTKASQNKELAKELWEWTQKELEGYAT